MIKSIKSFISIYLVLLVIVLPGPQKSMAELPSIYEKESHPRKESGDSKKETNINELLGPEDNFPFLPDNHRDSSNPIGRIGKITDLP